MGGVSMDPKAITPLYPPTPLPLPGSGYQYVELIFITIQYGEGPGGPGGPVGVYGIQGLGGGGLTVGVNPPGTQPGTPLYHRSITGVPQDGGGP